MKRLMLLRHAKSDWGNEGLPDFERPLNARGVKDALRMGVELQQRGDVPELLVTSTAVRALETVHNVTSAFGEAFESQIELEPRLYGASSESIIYHARSLPDTVSFAMLVGHNPGMEEAVARLTGQWNPDGMKTCTLASIEFDTDQWQNIADGEGTLNWILYPADLR